MQRLHLLPVLVLLAACGSSASSGSSDGAGEDETGETASAPVADTSLHCSPMGSPESLAERLSPLDSASVTLPGVGSAKLCYGRPSSRGREMIGGEHVPWGELWRMGANEPTTLHLGFPAELGGIPLEPGSYSLYARPGQDRWTLYASEAVDRWGIPIDESVRRAEVGEATVPTEATSGHVETLTFRFERPGPEAADLVMEWEDTRLTIPLRARTEG